MDSQKGNDPSMLLISILLEWYDYTSLGGCVIPMWFMTSNWSYIEFSRHIPMYPQRRTENTFTLEIREI